MEFNVAWYFIVGFVISFLGSIPTGMIALTVIQSTMEKGNKAGVMVVMGASVMEFVYTYIGLFFLEVLKHSNDYDSYIRIGSMVVFIFLGIYYLQKKASQTAKADTHFTYFDFGHGLFIGTLNMLVIPFWIVIGLWLESSGMDFISHQKIFIFTVAATLGAMLAFLGYVKLGDYVVNHLEKINRFTNKAVGFFFLLLALYQMTEVLGS